MKERRRVHVVVLAAVVAAASLAMVAWLAARDAPLEVTIRNESGTTLGGLVLVSDAGPRTAVPTLATGASARLTPRVGAADDCLTMLDSAGHRYALLAYFEGNPGGTLAVSVTGASDRGLSGPIVDRTHYAPDSDAVLEVLRQ
jgi:hypothetical protein